MNLMLSLIHSMEWLVVKVLMKQISLICFRVYLEVYVVKNPTCFSRWSVRNIRILLLIIMKWLKCRQMIFVDWNCWANKHIIEMKNQKSDFSGFSFFCKKPFFFLFKIKDLEAAFFISKGSPFLCCFYSALVL